jgi:hypothetical protein
MALRCKRANTMTKILKFSCDASTALRLHQSSLREGRCRSDLIRRAIEHYLDITPPNNPDIVVERVEFERGSKATAVFVRGDCSGR